MRCGAVRVAEDDPSVAQVHNVTGDQHHILAASSGRAGPGGRSRKGVRVAAVPGTGPDPQNICGPIQGVHHVPGQILGEGEGHVRGHNSHALVGMQLLMDYRVQHLIQVGYHPFCGLRLRILLRGPGQEVKDDRIPGAAALQDQIQGLGYANFLEFGQSLGQSTNAGVHIQYRPAPWRTVGVVCFKMNSPCRLGFVGGLHAEAQNDRGDPRLSQQMVPRQPNHRGSFRHIEGHFYFPLLNSFSPTNTTLLYHRGPY